MAYFENKNAAVGAKENTAPETAEAKENNNEAANVAVGATVRNKASGGKSSEDMVKDFIPDDYVDDEDILPIVIGEESEEDKSVVKFTRKYNFEGKIIDEVNIGKLKDITAKKSMKIHKLYRKITKELSVSPETTIEYAIAAASYVTGMPVEFFEQLTLPDITKIKTRVINFIYPES